MRQSPGTTLIPYTTLFRSKVPGPERAAQPIGDPLHLHGAQWRRRIHFTGWRREYEVDAQFLARAQIGLDRKSTRLNSSHLVISYAVFCLKKKSRYKTLGSF